MNKTVVFNFPDDFIFPKTFDAETCIKCPFWTMNAVEEMMCFLTGDSYSGAILCPFLSGVETIVYSG